MVVELIRYLLNEIDEELKYKEAYEAEEKRAFDESKEKGGFAYQYFDDKKFYRSPSKNLIKENAKVIRRLAMKLYEG